MEVVMDLNTFELIALWVIGVGVVVYFFFKVSRYSNIFHQWKSRKNDTSDDNFGNYAEQRFLEEDHPVSMSFDNSSAAVANTRESREKNLGYW